MLRVLPSHRRARVYRRAPRTAAALVLALVLILALSACGDSHTRVSTGTYAGESGENAPYLDVGPLVYEVQLSRQLNPVDSEDATYLRGLTADERKLGPKQEWFAVFLQVFNHSDQAHPAATNISISDTQGTSYIPVIPDQTNPFAYQGGSVPSAGRIPPLNSVASSGPTQGALLLFKINVVSLDNRPLELKLVDPENPGESATAELDV
ncbi:MAG TPA: hypothetical protein VLJ42_13140 [Solirubrobacteraceae bacterium]|nr:hypothetical protein [Solirubrobacteraceae bacterium]